MLRIHRQNKEKSSKSGERIDYKFSNFQALQVPKGWDKLFVSIISVETGKTIAKSSKALVRDGNCQWTETISESIWLSSDDSSKELEECLFKFVLSMGSARSGILGEVTVNMARYMNSRASAPVLLPLKKCNYGTILQVKIHCLTQKTKLRNGSKDSGSRVEDQNADSHHIGGKSNGSDEDSFARSSGSASSQDLGSVSHPGRPGWKEEIYLASASDHSFNSAEGSIRRENISLKNESSMSVRKGITRTNNSSPHGDYFADDHSTSSHSSFNTRITHSGEELQNHQNEFEQPSSIVIAPSSLANVGSSKNLLEAAEVTIEELRSEAKMWERNSRKLMLDMDILRKEFSDQSKKHADLEMELSASYTEHDGLKKEVEQLKSMLDETRMKQKSAEDSTYQHEGVIRIQKELENEIKFQQESYANMALQLKRTQESNIELVSVLQELEDTIEKQKIEIENLSSLQLRIDDMEKSMQGNSEENAHLLLQLKQMRESENKFQVNVQLLEQSLEEKNNDLEKEHDSYLQSLLDIEEEYKYKLSVKKEEIAGSETQLPESYTGRNSEEMGSTMRNDGDLIKYTETLKEKVQELEMDCQELTAENLELVLKLKELHNTCSRGSESFSSSSELPEKSSYNSEFELSELQSQIYHLQEDLKKKMTGEEQPSKLFPELFKQLEIALHNIKKPWYTISCDINERCESYFDNIVNLNKTDKTASKWWPEFSLDCFVELNKLLEAKIVECEKVLTNGEVEVKERDITISESQKKLEDYILKFQELENSKREQEKEIVEKIWRVEELECDLLSKDEENDFLRQCQSELEARVSGLQRENDKLEENIEIVQRESSITSKCLDSLQNDLVVLSGSVDSHVSANKILVKKSSELESRKSELELHLLKIEEENMKLSECISSLEAQLGHITDERESSRSELENSKSVVSRLQTDIGRLTIEMETRNMDLKQKLQDMQNQCSESEGKCANLEIENQKFQASAESLMEEYEILQISNKELRMQKLELEEHLAQLEAEVKESQESLTVSSGRIEALEKDLSSILEKFSLKEETLTSQLDALLQENKKQKGKSVLQESLFNQMCLEKKAEVETLQREVECLKKQISADHAERERIASEAVHELSNLRAEKAKLESAIQEVQSKVESAEDELHTLQTDSELKVQRLTAEIAASKQSHDLLMTDHDKILKSLSNYRSHEEKLKTAVNGLELKLTFSEYERQQLNEETSNLKVQLQKLTPVQDEVSALKAKLDESKFVKEKLETSLHSISRNCEELKVENISLVDKISNLQKAMSEFEDCKHKKIMERDFEEKEALSGQDAELRNELSNVKTTNNEYQQKIQRLEKEKDEYLRKAQFLEEELKLMEEKKQDRNESAGKKNNITKSTNQHFDSRRRTSAKTNQQRKFLAERQNSHGNQCQTEDGNEHELLHDGTCHAVEVDYAVKIQLLENDLAKALEANNKYKIQLQRTFSEGQSNQAAALQKSMAEGEVMAKERVERTKSSLETELGDLRERYFHMSLKCAEVEAQREDLVMKLREARNGKRWF